MSETETEYITIAVPRKHLRRMASDLSTLDPSQAEEHWAYLSRAIGAMEKSSQPAPENSDPGTNSYRQRRSQSFSSSLASSPTLPALSSRAGSAVPEGYDDEDDALDVPVMSLDLEEAEHASKGLDTSTMGPDANDYIDTSCLAPSDPPRGTKRSSRHLHEPQTSEEPIAPEAVRLRGGAAVMPWYCPRKGNRKRLPQAHSQAQRYGGFPMMDGANGPEVDSDAEDEDDGSGGEGDAAEGCNEGGMMDGPGLSLEGAEGPSSDNEEDAPKKRRRESQSATGRKSKGKGKTRVFKQLVRQHRTSKQTVDLMGSFAAMSTQRHQQNLYVLIPDICSSSLPASNFCALPTLSGLGALVPMLARVEGLIRQAMVLDFHRMISFMQLALWLDWLVWLKSCATYALLTSN